MDMQKTMCPRKTVEDVVKDVESTLGVKITSHKDATMIEKGGLEKEEEQLKEDVAEDEGIEADQEMSGMQQEPMMSGANHDEAQPQSDYSQALPPTSETKAQALEHTMPSDVPQPTFEPEEPLFEDEHPEENQIDDISAPPPVPDNMGQHHPLDGMGGMDVGDNSLMEDMDMVDTGDIDFIEHDEIPGEEAADFSGAPEVADSFPAQPAPQSSETQTPGAAAAATLDEGPVTLGETGEQQVANFEQAQQQQPVTTVTQEGTIATEPAIDATSMPQESAIADIGENDPGIGGTGENGLFDDGTFDDLTNMDDGAGDDGLIDFDGGMGMEDSAFGDALHGMDTHTPIMGLEGGGEEGEQEGS